MKWTFHQGLIAFMALVGIETYLDANMYVCNLLKAKLSIVFHHITSVYGMFGSILLGYYVFHLLFMVFVLFEHLLLGHCILTKYTQSLCKKSSKYHIDFLAHFVNLIGSKDEFLYVIALCVIMISFDSYMIYNNAINNNNDNNNDKQDTSHEE